MEFQHGEDVALVAELTLGAVRLAGCPNCHAPHPLAFSYWKRRFRDNTVCVRCGGPMEAPDQEVVVPAKLCGLRGRFAHFCFWMGEQLAKLARRLEK